MSIYIFTTFSINCTDCAVYSKAIFRQPSRVGHLIYLTSGCTPIRYMTIGKTILIQKNSLSQMQGAWNRWSVMPLLTSLPCLTFRPNLRLKKKLSPFNSRNAYFAFTHHPLRPQKCPELCVSMIVLISRKTHLKPCLLPTFQKRLFKQCASVWSRIQTLFCFVWKKWDDKSKSRRDFLLLFVWPRHCC